jgi:hypothetical protein
MRGNLKLLRSATYTVVLVVGLISCGPVPAKEEVVPKELVPYGYEQSECHYVAKAAEEENHNQGGFGGTASSAVVDARAMSGEHKTSRPFNCRHSVGVSEERCFDDNGVDHPMQWCLDRKAAREADKPTGSLVSPKVICGGPNGLIRVCDDES